MHYLALNPDDSLALSARGAVEVLCEHCAANLAHERVLVWVCSGLCVLLMAEDNRARFSKDTGPEAIVQVLKHAQTLSRPVERAGAASLGAGGGLAERAGTIPYPTGVPRS